MTDEPEYTQLSFENMTGTSEQGAASSEDSGETMSDGVGLGNALSIYQQSNIQFEVEDVLIPRLRLAQGLTQEVSAGTAKPGDWIMTGFGAYPTLTIVPVMFTRRRELTTPEFEVLCRSNDAKTGVGSPGGVCENCPMSKWAEGDKGKRIPPKCTFIYSYIVYIEEFGTLGMLEFKRTSIGAGKLLNTMIGTRGLKNFAAKLSATSQKGKQGPYYVAVVQPTVLSPETRQAMETVI